MDNTLLDLPRILHILEKLNSIIATVIACYTKRKFRLKECSCTLKNTDHENHYNVKDVWKMNYTGAGVVVAVVDEGLSPTHPELSKNYVSLETIILL